MGRIDMNDLGYAGDLGGRFGGTTCISAGDQAVDVVTEAPRGRNRMKRRGTQRSVVVLGEDEDSHGRIAMRDGVGNVVGVGIDVPAGLS